MVVDPVKIDRLCATRSVAGESQPMLPGKGVDQAGLPYVTSPQKCDFRRPGRWERGRVGGAGYEFRLQSFSGAGGRGPGNEDARRSPTPGPWSRHLVFSVPEPLRLSAAELLDLG